MNKKFFAILIFTFVMLNSFQHPLFAQINPVAYSIRNIGLIKDTVSFGVSGEKKITIENQGTSGSDTLFVYMQNQAGSGFSTTPFAITQNQKYIFEFTGSKIILKSNRNSVSTKYYSGDAYSQSMTFNFAFADTSKTFMRWDTTHLWSIYNLDTAKLFYERDTSKLWRASNLDTAKIFYERDTCHLWTLSNLDTSKILHRIDTAKLKTIDTLHTNYVNLNTIILSNYTGYLDINASIRPSGIALNDANNAGIGEINYGSTIRWGKTNVNMSLMPVNKWVEIDSILFVKQAIYTDTIHSKKFILDNATDWIFTTNGTDRWLIDSSGILRPNTNKIYDLGTSNYLIRNAYIDTLNVTKILTSNIYSGVQALMTYSGGTCFISNDNLYTNIKGYYKIIVLTTYADDAAAGTAGLTAGMLWKTADGIVHVKL